jgi:peptide deformylase
MNKLVAVAEIPRLTTEVAYTDPIAVYKKFHVLEAVCLREKGIGLCSVQIGSSDRMFVIRCRDDSFRYFVNTKYEAVGDDKFTSCEGCLSLPGRAFLVPRFRTVRIVGTEMLATEGVAFKEVNFIEDDPLYTAVFQHEIDHCFGIMIDELGQEMRVRPA